MPEVEPYLYLTDIALLCLTRNTSLVASIDKNSLPRLGYFHVKMLPTPGPVVTRIHTKLKPEDSKDF